MLLPIAPNGNHFSLLVIGTVASVALRNMTMNKEINRVVTTPLWSTTLPWDKRQALYVIITNSRPTDINKFDEMAARYVTLSTKIASAAMYGIVNMLHQHVGNEDKMKLMGAFAAFIAGGIGIGGTRHGSLTLDVFFRCVFGAGFIGVLYYVAEVSDIVLIRSIK